MTYETLKNEEELKYKRVYEYTCLFCKKKRKARKFTIAKGRTCSTCKKERLLDAEAERQIKLFDV